MPRVPIDYSQTCIYKLVHKDDVNNENVYIGSTTNFRHRKSEHKSSCNTETNKDYNNNKYKHIRENGGWDDWIMVEIEKYPCDDKREAEVRERYWVEFYKSNLNTCIPTRSQKEYRQDNCEVISERNKQYYQDNRDNISEQKKKHYQDNRYRNLERNKQYYEDNRDKLLEQYKQKTRCKCGCEVRKTGLKEHQRTSKHIKLMEQLNIPP